MSAAACTGEPISFLRLEQYLLGELATGERADVQAHLASCAACRACFDELRASDVVMPDLPSVSKRPAASRSPWPEPGRSRPLPMRSMAAPLLALAVAAAALLVLRPYDAAEPPRERVATATTKGGDVALSLVRERSGDSAPEPSTFLPGDRFEASVTCAARAARVHYLLYVMQAGEAFFPLPAPEPIACGNHVSLPGAFSLDGSAPATVCVVIDEHAPLDRAQVTRSAHPGRSACLVLQLAGR